MGQSVEDDEMDIDMSQQPGFICRDYVHALGQPKLSYVEKYIDIA